MNVPLLKVFNKNLQREKQILMPKMRLRGNKKKLKRLKSRVDLLLKEEPIEVSTEVREMKKTKVLILLKEFVRNM